MGHPLRMNRAIRWRLALAAAAACVVGLLPAAVGSASSQHSTAGIRVLAAASLTNVFPRIDSSPSYSFAGSDALAAQIRLGAPADVFASANTSLPNALYTQGLVEKPVVFTTNRLVVVVPKSNPAGIRTVFDLRRKGIKLVVGTPTVPIGSYTRTILKNLALTSVLANVVSQEIDVRSILSKVALGEADAGFVYVTDAKTVERQGEGDRPAGLGSAPGALRDRRRSVRRRTGRPQSRSSTSCSRRPARRSSAPRASGRSRTAPRATRVGRRMPRRRALFPLGLLVAAVVSGAFLLLPLIAIFTRIPLSTLVDQLGNGVVTDALVVSVKTTLIAQVAIIVFGTPTAYLLATRRFPGRALRDHPGRAAARAATRRRRHRVARSVRARRPARLDRCSSSTSRSRSRRRRS